ncbi:hypothetical protein [Kitasatospora atroaurantiaca]|uniref:Uncharacterized protein n=1 Tax=Kitasatospora atroaurantiaca TaxID=285545 RepID=A0A561EHS7_9ACTN|nr:hypothetical protein [Kitasatospora atroaurantiaca]TWE15160.1 hypothetical protein FB465_0032 [Kitasatospora atroaurantiaca]
MTPDRRTLALPAFSEPATQVPHPAPAGARRPLAVEQGADFRQPPGDHVPEPGPARRPLGTGDISFSAPDRTI